MEEYELTDSEFRLLRQLIYDLTGIALADCKRQLVKSRLQKRLRHHKISRFQDYYNLVLAAGKDSAECTEFINCITTNKTDFFREQHHFEFVTQKILPEIIEEAERGNTPRRLRIWHAGCSTGEEPYTLAVTLAEALEGQSNWDVRQLASDIDTAVLAHAEKGVYDLEKTAPVPDALLRKYFLRGSGAQEGYVRVRKELRERIAFRQINLLEEPWPIRQDIQFDMIFCRNVVIYFDKPTQRRLFARYQERLKPGGYLFIGHSESLCGISEAFKPVGKTIYQLPELAVQRARAA